MFKLLISTFLFMSLTATAREMIYLMRSPRALLMGDAYTAIADDAYTLFYNPAILGRNENFEITVLNPEIHVTNILDEADRFDDFPKNDEVAIANRLVGFPLYARLGFAPGLKMGPFGLSFIAANSMSFQLKNLTHPFLDLDYRYDRGFEIGGAVSHGDGRQGENGHRASVGIGIKKINREGISGNFDFFGTKLLNAISSGVGSAADIRTSLGYSKGKAWGLDLGLDYAHYSGNSAWTTAFSILDVGDTQFKKTEGSADIPKQEMMVNFGTAWHQDFTIFDYTLSFDFHPINQPIDFMRKVHLGMELDFQLVTFMAGINEGYLSYGLALDIWFLNLSFGAYAVELGTRYKEKKGSRAFVQVNLIDISFDAR